MNQKQNQHYRIRIRFAKNEDLRFLGHLDLIRALERIFRRAGFELAMSEGFHPRPRMRFSGPLPVGQVGLDEVMDLVVVAIGDPDLMREQLNQFSVPGLEFKHIEILNDSVEKLKAKSFCYEVPVDPEFQDTVKINLERFLLSNSHFVQKKGRQQQIDIRPLVFDLRLEDGQLQMQLAATQEAGVRPAEILELLDLSANSQQGAVLTRTTVQL